MPSDRLFAMQSFISMFTLILATALIFYDSNETRFTIGVTLFGTITGYWFTSPLQSASKKEVDSRCCNCSKNRKNRRTRSDEAHADESCADENDYEGEGESEDIADDDDDIPLDDVGKGSSIGGLSSSVRDSVSRIESGEAGKSPHSKKGSVIDSMTSNANAHIAT